MHLVYLVLLFALAKSDGEWKNFKERNCDIIGKYFEV